LNFFQQEPIIQQQQQQQQQPGEQFMELTTQFLVTFNEDLSRGTFDSNETEKTKIGMYLLDA
jgi:hypothetical protein